MTILANDIKKGWKIRDKHGDEGVMNDNKKGNVREVRMPNMFNRQLTIGTMYVRDLRLAQDPATGEWHKVVLSAKQVQDAKMITKAGF